MVSIDTVYQRVLALANKEQRGYITPQEFNLFANQAQLEILDQYFHTINQWGRQHGNDTEYSDMLQNYDERLAVFKTTIQPITNGTSFALPNDLYRLGTVFSANGRTIIEPVNEDEWAELQSSPLTEASMARPVYRTRDNRIFVTPPGINIITISYIRRPIRVGWGYVVVNDKALYDPTPNKTINFELHPKEQTELVYRILKLSGAAIQRQDIASFAQAMQSAQDTEEKS